ncbi:CRISPR-associated endonuclease/helicase Cas3 [Peptoclostridium litorale DSM 5388]|uniref:CRISPR-associated nuclease/helicase Cas3 n=1 Tax=Peptoclostridium litorale DSM 5388 TaxID=1121324 RepID=A0A069RFY8_PEPLI|nr:CRISPR-associated helicase/endonuclease Cas3 [Peptoclostridium litorale]KDR95718.1 CRISPR-associated nuclease/helicase Cas3 [Peptoclostridium litorale DSM 5388]SIO22688.1 CRISPR-associated endonuclease/helicase Cas3 [Peptoclostridium litorale DSM 5388]
MDLNNYNAKPHISIEQHNIDLLNRAKKLKELNYISDKALFLLEQACYYHDLGKINPYFQNRVINGGKFNKENEFAHNLGSVFFINKDQYEESDYVVIANAVLNHHNYVKNYDELQKKDVREQILKQLQEMDIEKIYRVTKKTVLKLLHSREDDLNILVKGLLHKCDYSASAGIEIEYKNDFLNEGLNTLLSDWKKERENADWKELQRFCISKADSHIMITAQTGMGKTEAGLLWIGDYKGFFILPLKAAINAIYDRIRKKILYKNEALLFERLTLLHSDSISIQKTAAQEMSREMELEDYYAHSKQLSIPLNIATLDQIFNFVFKYPGYELKLATLSYSKIVIDEIQMYSPDLLAYLIYGMKRISSIGGKLAIMTATLAPFVKKIIKEKTKIRFEEGVFFNDIKRHNIQVIKDEISAKYISDKISELINVSKSSKVLVVCNTVRKAQKMYEELSKLEITENINLLHSKFTKMDRALKEKEIIEFGRTLQKEGTIHMDNGIWISTQIVEASLDIDFDYLFTELSELNGLFQRLGRCNRQGLKSSSLPNCFVFTKINSQIIRKPNSSRGFIYEDIHTLSKSAIENISGILTEREKNTVIDHTFSYENLKDSQYYHDFKYYYEKVEDLFPGSKDFSETVREFRDIQSCDVIPYPVYERYKEEIESIYEKYEEKSIKWIERKDLIDDMRNYTMPMDMNILFSKKSKQYGVIKKTFKINKFTEIYIIQCEYDENIGFKRLLCEETVVNNFL